MCVNTLSDGNILATFFDNNKKKTVNKAKLVFFIIQTLKVIAKNVYETVRVTTVYRCRDMLTIVPLPSKRRTAVNVSLN